VNDKLDVTCNEAAVVYFKVLTQEYPGRMEENYEEP
jgi:hypothetical protein